MVDACSLLDVCGGRGWGRGSRRRVERSLLVLAVTLTLLFAPSARAATRGSMSQRASAPRAQAATGPAAPSAPLVGRQFGIGLLMGGTWGGDELAAVDNSGSTVCIIIDGRNAGCGEGGIERVSAGDGLEISFSFRYTPWWWKGHGFGVGLRAGIHVASNDLFLLLRFPVVPEAHTLLRVADPLYLVVAAGPVVDLGAGLHFDNGVDQQSRRFDIPVGAMIEVGPRFLWTFSDGSGALGINLPLRYTWMTYKGGERSGPADDFMPSAHSFSANSLGFVPGIEILF